MSDTVQVLDLTQQVVAEGAEKIHVVTVGIPGAASLEVGAVVTQEGYVPFGGPGGAPDAAKDSSWPIWRSPDVFPYPDGTPYASMLPSTGINAAIAKAKAMGITPVARETYRVDSLVTIDCNHDFKGATFVCNDNSLAPVVRVGSTSASVFWLTCHLPDVTQAAKTGTGWTGTSVAYELCNLNRCEVHLGRARNFVTPLLLRGTGSRGCAYNSIHKGHCDNGKTNVRLHPDTGSDWVNENEFYGLSCSHDSAEGTNVSGTRHILIEGVGASQPNNNVWYRASLESPGVVEYQVESIAGIFNWWINCRWEHTGGNPKVYWNEVDATRFSRDNRILGGYNASQIVETYSTNSKRCRIDGETSNRVYGASTTVPAIRFGNATSDAGPQIEGVDLSVDPGKAASTDWRWRNTANAVAVKAKADTVARKSTATATGNDTYSDGTNAADAVFYRASAGNLRTDTDLTIARHFISQGTAPSPASGTAAGTGPTLTVTGNDISGRINLTTGSAPAATNADLVTLTFATAFASAPKRVVIEPSNTAAKNLTWDQQPYWNRATSSASATVFKGGNTALAATTAYEWTYEVIG